MLSLRPLVLMIHQAQHGLNTLSTLIPCFALLSMDKDFCRNIVNILTPNFPPRSVWDDCRIKVILPVLAAIYCDGSPLSIFRDDEAECCGALIRLLPYLCAYSLGSEKYGTTRSAATSCLFSMLSDTTDSHLRQREPPAQGLLRDSLSPSIFKASQSETESTLEHFYDAVNLVAFVVSTVTQVFLHVLMHDAVAKRL